MRSKEFLLSGLLTIFLLCGCGPEQDIKRGEKAFSLGEYHEASVRFKQAYTRLPAKERGRRAQVALRMAQSYEKLNAAQRAVAAYRNAVRYGHRDIDTRVALGTQLLKSGDYKAAATEFKAVLDSVPGHVAARIGLQSATIAPQLKQEGSRYIVKRMDVFNSQRADFSPVLTGDSYDRLYFTSTRKEALGTEVSDITGMKAGDIFVSEKNDRGVWMKPHAVEGSLNTEYDEGSCAFTPDGREMYLTQCTSDPVAPRYAKIAVSARADASWGKATIAEITRDTLSLYAHPAISPDGQWLYFTSNMPGGKGGLDLWRIRITSAGFGGVENLGEPINTAGNEEFPTFRPNGDLYFSSDGFPGMGGLDIYVAKIKDNRRWHVEHPGYPLNSQGDDFGMTFEGLHNRGFFSSNRGDARGWDHIYSFENPEIIQTVKGWVYEQEGYELTAAQVYMVGNDGTNLKLNVKGDGSFQQEVTAGVDYVFMATCKGFLNHQETLRVPAAEKSEEYVLQFPLASITAPVLIDNIFYDFNRATLRPESTAALDELVKLLQENPHVTIELRAHCDYRGSDIYNKVLSQRRAEAVTAYLVAHGIAKDRLSPVGYGKERPKIIRRKLTERYPWMKEGDVLSESYIKRLDASRQDVCNQLNRRTEFIVLRTTYGLFDKDGRLKQQPASESPHKDVPQNTEMEIVVE